MTGEQSRRNFLKASALLVAGSMATRPLSSFAADTGQSDHRVVLLISGGVRRAETFSTEGVANIPVLGSLLPKSTFSFGKSPGDAAKPAGS